VLAEFGGASTGTAAHMAEQSVAASSVFATPAPPPLLDPQQSLRPRRKQATHRRIITSSHANVQASTSMDYGVTGESLEIERETGHKQSRRSHNGNAMFATIPCHHSSQWPRPQSTHHARARGVRTTHAPAEYAPRTHPRSTHHARTRRARTTHAPAEYAPRTHLHARTRAAAPVSPRD